MRRIATMAAILALACGLQAQTVKRFTGTKPQTKLMKLISLLKKSARITKKQADTVKMPFSTV